MDQAEENESGYDVFTLTDLTGKRAANNRTKVIFVVDVKVPLIYAFLAAIMPSLLVAIIVSLFLKGASFIVALPLSLAVGIWFFYARSAKGLKLRQFQRFKDRSKARKRNDVFYVCGIPLPDVGEEDFQQAWCASQPVRREVVDVAQRVSEVFDRKTPWYHPRGKSLNV